MSSACKLLTKMIQYFWIVGIIFWYLCKPFGAGNAGRFYFGTKFSSSWCILSIIGGITMKKALKQIKYMKSNRSDLFQQFIFGATMATLSFLQIVSVLLVCVFL